MPAKYRVNEMPDGSIMEAGHAVPKIEDIQRGILTAAECAECVGGQLGRGGDRTSALLAALLVDRLHQKYGSAFAGQLRWNSRIPGDLGTLVCNGLNERVERRSSDSYSFQGLEEAQRVLIDCPWIKAFIDNTPTQAGLTDRVVTREGDPANDQ